MRYRNSIFASLLKPISRTGFKAIVERHDADAYDKTFSSWDHLVLLIFAQLGSACSLRGLAASWNANAHHHYHLGTGPVARSTFFRRQSPPPAGRARRAVRGAFRSG